MAAVGRMTATTNGTTEERNAADEESSHDRRRPIHLRGSPSRNAGAASGGASRRLAADAVTLGARAPTHVTDSRRVDRTNFGHPPRRPVDQRTRRNQSSMTRRTREKQTGRMVAAERKVTRCLRDSLKM